LRVGSPYAVAGMALVALVAERATIRLTPALETSMASLPFAFAAIVAGPLAAAIVGSVGLLVDLGRRDDPNPHLRWLAWTAKRVLSAGAAGLAASAIAETLSGSLWVTLAAAATGACAADAVVDLVLASATLLVRRKAHALHVARNLGPLYVVSVPLYASVLTVLAYAYVVISPWLTLLFLLPAFGVQRLFVLYRQQRDAAEALVVVNERLAQANASFASALVATLDARDRYTAGHSAAVAVYARDIASRLGLSEHHQNLAYLGGLVHDIGKIGLAPGLLEKPGALTPDERRQMEQHPVIGETIVQNVEDYSEIADAVRHHHERLDGNGYPDGRSGEAIPFLARIISVADAYNAMTSDRPYRDAMATEVARTRLREAAGSQFDPAIVDAFDCVLAEESESYRRAKRSDFGIDARVSPPPVLLRAA
jgi:putative nucleotidyltransferase with HDIG domain